MSLAMDPSEYPGTPEYEELQTDRELQHQQMLDLMAEEQDYELVQYPQRFSH